MGYGSGLFGRHAVSPGQGTFKMLSDLVQSVFAFINKLVFKAQFEKGKLAHFPTLLNASEQVTSTTLNKQ